MAKKIFKHVVVTTFYTSEPIVGGMSLSDIAFDIDEGDSIGNTEYTSTDEPIVGKKAIKDALLEIGNDGTFFG